MKRLQLITVCLMMFLMSIPLSAQTGDWAGKWSFQLLGGSLVQVGEKGHSKDAALALGGKLNFHLSDLWTTELTAVQGGYFNQDRDDFVYYGEETAEGGYSLSEKRASFIALNQSRYLTRGSFRPYLTAGIGVYWETIRLSDYINNLPPHYERNENADVGCNFGIGGEKRINESIGIVVDARVHKVANAGDIVSISAGVNALGAGMDPLARWFQRVRPNRFSIQVGGGVVTPWGDWANGANIGGLAGVSLKCDMTSRFSIALSGVYSPRVQTDSHTYPAYYEYSVAINDLVAVNGVARQYLSNFHFSLDQIYYLTNWRARPYVMVGAGYYEYRDIKERAAPTRNGGESNSESKHVVDDIGISAGMGVDIRVHPMASLVAGVRYHRTFADRYLQRDMHMVSYKAGVNFYAN